MPLSTRDRNLLAPALERFNSAVVNMPSDHIYLKSGCHNETMKQLQALSELLEDKVINDVAEQEVVHALRVQLFDILENADYFDENFMDLTLDTLQLLGIYWPANKKNKAGQHLDALTQEPLDRSEGTTQRYLISAAGFWMDAEYLNEYFKRSYAYDLSEYNEVLHCFPIRNTLDQMYFYPQEIKYFIQNGITVLDPSPELIEASHATGLGGCDIDVVSPELTAAANQLIVDKASRSGFDMMAFYVGVPVFIALLIASVLIAPPLTPLALGFMFGFPVLVGAYTQTFTVEGGFFSDMLASSLANWVAISLVALVVPQAVTALAAFSLISAATSAAVMAAMPLVLALVPAAVFAVGAVAQALTEEGFSDIYSGILIGSANVFRYAFGLIGYGVGAVIGSIKLGNSAPLQEAQPAEGVISDQTSDFYGNSTTSGFLPNMTGIYQGLDFQPGMDSADNDNVFKNPAVATAADDNAFYSPSVYSSIQINPVGEEEKEGASPRYHSDNSRSNSF